MDPYRSDPPVAELSDADALVVQQIAQRLGRAQSGAGNYRSGDVGRFGAADLPG